MRANSPGRRKCSVETPKQCSQFAVLGTGRGSPGRVLISHPVPRRLIELHSPDSRNTLVLRCRDTATAHAWFSALHANITALLPQVLAELNATLGSGSPTAGGREVKHIAWLAEQVRTDGMCWAAPRDSSASRMCPGCHCSCLGTGFAALPSGCAPVMAAFPMPSAPSQKPIGIFQLEPLITPSLFHEFTA